MIVVNGVNYSGKSVTVSGDKVVVNGKQVDLKGQLEVQILVYADDATISTDSGKITVAGNTKNINTLSGNVITEGYIEGNVSTMSGDVIVASSIHGNVSTMSGDIRYTD